MVSKESSRVVRVLKLGAFAFVFFVAGFLTHRHRLQDYVQPALAWLKGDTGGCGLVSAYSVVLSRLGRSTELIRRSSRLVQKTPDGLEAWQTERGLFWVPEGTQLPFVLAEQAIRIYGDGKYRVQPGDLVLDAGANVGAFTREALNAGAKRVIAIEPAPPSVEALRRTFQKEIQEGRVQVVAKGVWNKEDIL
jgi:hypothetical protein